MNAVATQHNIQEVATLTLPAGERIPGLVRTWVRRANERRVLAELNDRMLADIGLTRIEVERETRKYFWQK